MAELVAGTRYEDMPLEVVETARLLILDTLACQIGGYQTDLGSMATELARSEGGNPAATIVGAGELVSAPAAAVANARFGATLDGESTFGAVHCVSHHGNAAVAAALAMGEEEGRSGKELIAAVAIGFDVGARVGAAMGPPSRVPQTGHLVPTRMGHGPVPYMAAAAATAHALRLDAEFVSHAFGITGLYVPIAPEKWLDVETPPLMKSADAGWQALGGLTAARLAARGATGFEAIFEGEHSLWKMLDVDGCDYDLLLGDLGRKWLIQDVTFKPWPCQRWMHYSLTAFHRLLKEEGYRPEEIERVVVLANARSGGRRFTERQPRDAISCQFSYPHAVAMMALGVPPGPAWFAPGATSDPRVRELRGRVEVVVPPEVRREDPAWFAERQIRRYPGGVEVTARGRTRRLMVDRALGDPWYDDTRFGEAQIVEKVRSFAGPLAPADARWWRKLDRLAQTILSLEQVANVRELRPLLHR